MHKGLLLGLLASAFVAVACSSSSAPDPYPTSAAFCSALAKAECAKVASDCSVDPTACENARTSNCTALVAGTPSKNPDYDPFAAVTSSRTYTSSAVQGCLDATNNLYGTIPVPLSGFQSQQAACNAVFQGAGIVNAACASDFDCQNGLICDKSVCAQQSQVAAGSFCDSPGQVCDDNNYCAAQANGNKECVARPSANQACTTVATASSPLTPCGQNLTCQNDVCVAAQAAGGTCTSSVDCGSAAPLCDLTLGGKCGAGLFLGGGSKACDLYGGTF